MAVLAPILAVFSTEHRGQSHTAVAQAELPQSPPLGGGYVGSKVCAECHRAIYSVHSQTDMGRSMSVVSSALLEKVPNSSQIFDAKLNRHFGVSVEDGGLYQHEYETLPDGKEVFRDTRKIEWIIGAGANGFGGIVSRGDTLFEALLSFYSKTQHWALSPGYESYDFGFSDRPAMYFLPQRPPSCGTRWEWPLSRAPLCRVSRWLRELSRVPALRTHPKCGSTDRVEGTTISPLLTQRNFPPGWHTTSVCHGHQTGDARVLQPGKTFHDFRPGAPLNDTLVILIVPPKRNEISHSALTNHRILRESGEPYPEAAFHMTTPELPDLVYINAIATQKRTAIPPLTLLQAYGQLINAHPEYRERYFTLAAQLRESDPDDISVLEALAYGAQTKQSGGDAAEAIDYSTRGIRRNSTRPADFEQCASLLIRAGKLPEAFDVLQRGIKTIPHGGELYRLLGLCYSSQNKPVEAAELLTRAAGMFPENSAIRSLLFQSRKAISEK